jgi:hypothetical protein
VTPKGRDGFTEAHCWWQIDADFWLYGTDGEMTDLKKHLEEPEEFKLLFVRDSIRFRRFSTTNQIHSYGFDK